MSIALYHIHLFFYKYLRFLVIYEKKNYNNCIQMTVQHLLQQRVKVLDSNCIQRTGLVVNIEKSQFLLTQIIKCLGLSISLKSFPFQYRIAEEEAVCCLEKVISFDTARELAQLVIISMTLVMCNIIDTMKHSYKNR